MRLFKKIITLLVIGLLLSGVGAVFMNRPAYALFDNAKNQAQCGANLDESTNPDGTCADTTDSGNAVSTILKNVLNILSLVAGVIAVIMIIISGIRFVTSQGDASSVASARNTIIYALIGIVVVVLAQFVVFFVIQKTAAPSTATPPAAATTP